MCLITLKGDVPINIFQLARRYPRWALGCLCCPLVCNGARDGFFLWWMGERMIPMPSPKKVGSSNMVLRKEKSMTRWWFQFFQYNVQPYLGEIEMIQFDSYFFKWVGSTCICMADEFWGGDLRRWRTTQPADHSEGARCLPGTLVFWIIRWHGFGTLPIPDSSSDRFKGNHLKDPNESKWIKQCANVQWCRTICWKVWYYNMACQHCMCWHVHSSPPQPMLPGSRSFHRGLQCQGRFRGTRGQSQLFFIITKSH